ncbi:MAG TPA: hypothetical protein VN455_09370 [Methanotrichaceae archaeon]|nr:hypothetical protein [Methanotrichaceae archaeon]
MELELGPAMVLQQNMLCVMISPVEMLSGMLNSHLDLQRFQTLFVCGNYSRVLDRLDRRFVDLNIRRAFTAFQLLTILEEAHQTLVIIEHDPLLYEEAEMMTEYISLALEDLARGSAVLLYSPSTDPYLDQMAARADRVCCFGELARSEARKMKSDRQTTLGAF